jgi:hypothetical protein
MPLTVYDRTVYTYIKTSRNVSDTNPKVLTHIVATFEFVSWTKYVKI